MKVADGIERPNGIQLSRDEKTLFVNNTSGEYLLAFDIQSDGSVTNRRNFAKYEGATRNENGVSSGADGLALDSQGRIYVAASTGVQVFSPQGQHLGTIPLSRPPQNLAFAGAGKKTLYVVGSGALGPDGQEFTTPEGVRNNAKTIYKLPMRAQGFKGRAK